MEATTLRKTGVGGKWGCGMKQPQRTFELLDVLKEVWSVNLIAYVDESGTHDAKGLAQGADTAGVFGYIASPEEWEVVAEEWTRILVEFGVKCFHASEFADRKNGPNNPAWPYRGWDDATRDSFIRKLITIARDGTYFSVGGIVVVRAYDENISEEHKKDMEHPYQFCFQLFLDQLLYAVNNHLEPPLCPTDKVDFHFDRQSEMEDRARRTFSTIKCIRDPQCRLGSISFDDKSDFIPLQTADLLAYVMRQSASRKMKGDWTVKSGGWEQQLVERGNAIMGYYDDGVFKNFLTGITNEKQS